MRAMLIVGCGPRPETPTSRARKVSISLQVHVRDPDAAATIVGVRCIEEPAEQRELHWLLACRTSKVSLSWPCRSTWLPGQRPGPVTLRAQSCLEVGADDPSFSASTSASSSNYDRPNRLKGREDGSIRWVELLEKFRSVQERARRVQRHSLDGDDVPPAGVSELRIGDGPLDTKGKDGRGPMPGAAPPVPQKDAAPAAPMPAVKKSGLGRQFGRLGGAVSGKNRRNQ